ncbi:ATP-binding protein [Rhizobium sp. NPDC090279]|uniref:ATP-binding protein n=1 Tax=Rhizobium sp. NPDC090279 TaxID=3364499 RepID=UPI00383A7394
MTNDFSFHAYVAAEAIEKVGRLFNASIDDILNELLQNARRAGATKVVIDQIVHPRFGDAIRIADDGAGLDDPRSLFSLGYSNWSETLSRSEDAAGMGFFALANRGAIVLARQKNTENAWTIEATPDAFHGRQLINAQLGPKGHAGMTVIFPEGTNDNLADAVCRAARHFPLPVDFNGAPMASADFLNGASRVEEWRGIRIGVFDRDLAYGYGDNANFHGVTLRILLPWLRQSWHSSYCARIDVVDCAYLKLVLPARKEVVRDAMYEGLVLEINRVYFRLVAAGGPHSLAFSDYQRALSLGVELQEAEPFLRPFFPAFAESDRNETVAPRPVGPNAHIYEGGGPLEEQNVARAFAVWNDAPPIFEPNHAYAGYVWYDRLSWITLKNYRMIMGDVVEEIDPDDSFETEGRPDRLEMALEVLDTHVAEIRHLETDLLVAGPDYGTLEEVDIRVTRQSTITPAKLQTFLIDALFSPSDDAEDASYEQQLEWFTDAAEDRSINLLQSEADADLNAIVRAVERELVWRVPKHGSIVIRIDDGKVSVEGLPSIEGAAEASPRQI